MHDMLHLMYEVSAPPMHPIPEVSPAARWDRVKDALGVTTKQEAARQIGMPLITLQRLIDNPDTSLMRNSFLVRARTGLGLDELFPVDRQALSTQLAHIRRVRQELDARELALTAALNQTDTWAVAA